MTVAALQAVALGEILLTHGGERDTDLATDFFAQASPVVADAWSMSTNRDFMYPQTRGERPADFAQIVRFGGALNGLAARDPDVHKLVSEVRHMLKPNRALEHPDVVERVHAFMTTSELVRPPATDLQRRA
jgi:hypothetical protein